MGNARSQKLNPNIKSVFRRALFACMTCALLALAACGTSPPEQTGTPAPGDRSHAMDFFQREEPGHPVLNIGYGEGGVLGWAAPATDGGSPELTAAEILKANPPVTMRLPLVYQKEDVNLVFEGQETPEVLSLEDYPLDEDGNLLFRFDQDHSVGFFQDGNFITFGAVPCLDWTQAPAESLEAVYRPQGYILRCRIGGRERVYVFRIGVLVPQANPAGELDALKPQSPQDVWDLSPFVLVEAKSTDRPMGGGLYLMTDAERRELLGILKPETWSVLENPEARGMEGAPWIATLGHTSLRMDDANQDGSVTIAISNRYSEERFIYTAPQEVMDGFRAFTYRMGDDVFPERLR